MHSTDTLSAIQKICKTPTQYRSPTQLSFLQSCTKEIKLFKDLSQKHGESSHLGCCQNILYEFIPSGEYVFKYGDIGTKFYILLQGLVTIYIPTSDSGKIVYKEIMTFTSGGSFGELALESSKPRSASALCKSDSHFLVLLQKDYSKFMQRLVFDKKNEMINFLHSLPAFKKLNRLAVSKLIYNIKEVSFTKGQTVFNEGEQAKEIFIVKDGECKLSKIISKPVTSTGIRKIVFKRAHTAKRVGVGSMVAEDDILNRQPHSYSCVCSSDSVNLYVVPADDFFFRITAEQPLKYMKRVSKGKKNFLEGWTSCRANLDSVFAKSVEMKAPTKKRNISDLDNIQKLKKAMSEKRKIEGMHLGVPASGMGSAFGTVRLGHSVSIETPMADSRVLQEFSLQMPPSQASFRHKKGLSHQNLFLLTSPKGVF